MRRRLDPFAPLLLLGCGTDATALDTELYGSAAAAFSARRGALVALGREIFEDTNLSSPAGQSCASCHKVERGFSDPDDDVPTSEGVLPGRVGVRNTPMAAYASFIPPLTWDPEEELYVGGLFLDGRADSLEAQAGLPFLNPLEMNNPSKDTVVAQLRRASYRGRFERVFGRGTLAEVDGAYAAMTRAIAAFERTTGFQPFSSKYDAFLAGRARLTRQERRGLALFEDPTKGNCAACHPTTASENGLPPMLTDFTYDNIGVPRNLANAFYSMPPELNPAGAGFIDRGLGKTVDDPAEDGKFRVSSLRNVALSAPYAHNGFFADLRSVVQFYNTRDVADWGAPEVPETVNHDELGNLGLSDAEVDAIVAFLETLTGGYK